MGNDRDTLVALKAAVAAALRAARPRYRSLYRKVLHTDPRLRRYIFDVIKKPADHNLYELLKIRRFFTMCQRYAFDGAAVQRFCRFYESLPFSGVAGRQRYTLTPVQVFQYANIFGFVHRDDPSRRVIRTVYIFVPRKFSKTTSAAALAVYDLLVGDNNAEAYIGANSYDQAKKCFNEVRAIMREIDPAERTFRINRESITYRRGERDSLVQCLTANAKTKDGLSASLAILDEYAQARNTKGKNGADLKNVLTTSMATRRNPLTVIITTASDVFDGPFYAELEGVQRVLRGEVENDSIFADLFMPDVDDEEGDPHTWRKVQPHLGITVQPDFYAAQWADAQLSAESMVAFRTKLLNIFAVNERHSWFTPTEAHALLGDFVLTHVEGCPECAVAFDLSVHDDFSAVSYTIYSRRQRCFFSHTDYYIPAGAVAGHPNEQLYRRWHEDGFLKFCDGNVIDVRMIAGDILARSRQVKIIRIGYDAYKSKELVNILSSLPGGAAVLTPYKQTYGSFNLAVESFEMMARSVPPRIILNANPINAYCLANCVIDTDNLNNKKPVKATATRKIDGTVTLLMTIGLLDSYKR